MSGRGGPIGRYAGLAVVVLLATVFAFLNGGDRMSIHLGFTVLYRVPVVVVVFVSFLAGMVTMFLLGLRHDLKVRRYLRERRLTEEPYGGWTPGPPLDDEDDP